MRVSREQLAAFEPVVARRFVDRVAAALREHFEGLRPVTDAELRAFVLLGAARAAEHGFHEARYIRMYTGLMLHLGPDLDRDGHHPWVAEILANRAMDAGTRMACLYERAEALPATEDAVSRLRALIAAQDQPGASRPHAS